jgi:predicted HTH domain antitoxin
MKTLTLSVRLAGDEVDGLDAAAAAAGLDRSALLKQFVRRGFAQHRFETACAAYRQRDVSLSRAAEMAGLSLYDFLLRLPEAGLELSLTPADLRQELAAGVDA